MLAALRDTPYKIVLLLHIITMIASMAGAVAHPLLMTLEQRRDDGDVVALAQRVVPASRIYMILFAVSGLIGFGLISMGDWGWGETWIWLSIVIWVAANGVLHGALMPAEQALAGGDASAVKRVERLGQVATVLILVLLYLMVLKPGGSAL